MNWRPWTTLLVVVICPASARADMGLPWDKRRPLSVVIDNLGDYPEYRFYLVPQSWLERVDSMPQYGECRLVSEHGVVFNSRAYMGKTIALVLMAVPRAWEDSKEHQWGVSIPPRPTGVLHSSTVHLFRVPDEGTVLCPIDYEVRHLRVEMEGGQLTVTPAGVEHRSEGITSWLPGVLFSAAVVSLGLWLARRWRRSREAWSVPEGKR
jgi:hypothetical protein